MPVVYADAPGEAVELLDGVISEFFIELSRLAIPLKVDLRMARTQADDDSDDGATCAVKRYGHGVPAKVAVVGPVERSRGGPDVRIVVDAARWDEAGEESRRAMLFSELNRVEPKRDKEGGLKLDPYGRPQLRLRPYDWCVAGYRETVRVFGESSPEQRDLAAVERMLSQGSLSFMAAAGVD